MDNWNPQQYNKFKDQREKPFQDLVSLIQKTAQPKIVDLGCGTGELTLKLHDLLKAKSTLGIDSSKNMLDQAATKSKEGLSFESHDIREFKPDQPYDIVFSHATLQWVSDHKNLFPKIFNWVAPGGQVAIQMPFNFDHPSHQIAADLATCLFPKQFPKGSRRDHVLGLEQYSQMLHQNGFAEQECFVKVYGHAMASGKSLIEWTKGTLLTSYQNQLSIEDFQKFYTQYEKEILAYTGEGPYFYPFKRMLLWGKK